MLSVVTVVALLVGEPPTVTIPGLGEVIGTATPYGSEFKGYEISNKA